MKRIKQIHGFTLLEVLTAMAIIAVMIGLLLPAIGKIQTVAMVVKQRAQFNAIGTALEAFRSDSGWNDYPPSSYTNLAGDKYGVGGSNHDYTGAQKLAEALVGWDGFGFHPKSQWRSDGMATNVLGKDGNPIAGLTSLYHIGTDINNFETSDENLNIRKGPYLEVEKANAVKVSSLYASNSRVADTYVLADMFRTVKNRKTGGRTGMPILYFRADTAKTWGVSNAQGIPTDPLNCIYNRDDNFYGFVLANAPWDITQRHLMRDDPTIFYQRIKNPNFPGTAANNYTDARPYHADSYILLSAGPDGLYGSADDVYNFDESGQ
jgi:prepilin-type N-terminal cleavage/methylation domain-containing protein